MKKEMFSMALDRVETSWMMKTSKESLPKKGPGARQVKIQLIEVSTDLETSCWSSLLRSKGVNM